VKLVHLVSFIIKKFVTMNGHMNVKKETRILSQTGLHIKHNLTENFVISIHKLSFFFLTGSSYYKRRFKCVFQIRLLRNIQDVIVVIL
jgi:hypothetical protein